jgi:MOSC domain-containing protein YiiM
MTADAQGVVTFVGLNEVHGFSKRACQSIELLEGRGVAGDAHCGATVKHRSRVAKNPAQPNLRQVHLIQGELHDELAEMGFRVVPGDMGENITTRGLPLLTFPVDTRLHLGAQAVVQLTGLRNPCAQLDDFQPGLMRAVLGRDAGGNLVRKAGVMGIVLHGGQVRPGDAVTVALPVLPHRRLERV